jgi:two-component system chemotaxis response regulator CheB
MKVASKRETSETALRTVIVDDSALARLMLRDALTGIDNVQVVGNAAEGSAALEVIDAVKPGLIILDVEMPGMNGLEMLQEMNFRNFETPVLMCSRLTSVGAEVTTEALLLGAYDFVCKPSGATRQENILALRNEIAQKIGPLLHRADAEGSAEPIPTATHSLTDVAVDAVLIGASTGGPAALQTLLARLDPKIDVPILVVQHIPVGFSEPLARRLGHASSLPVVEASDGADVVGGTVYISRGGQHMKIDGSTGAAKIQLIDSPPVNGCRPSVDVMFDSARKQFGKQCLVVMLTGMGRDGAAGAQAIREGGGIIFAQHPDTCSVSSMPRQTINLAGADRIADLAQLGELINSVTSRQRSDTAS